MIYVPNDVADALYLATIQIPILGKVLNLLFGVQVFKCSGNLNT